MTSSTSPVSSYRVKRAKLKPKPIQKPHPVMMSAGASPRGKHFAAKYADVALIRLAMRNVHDALSDVTTFAHRTPRGISLRSGKLQRCYRDAHAGPNICCSPTRSSWSPGGCWRVLMGATGPGAFWTMFAVKGKCQHRHRATFALRVAPKRCTLAAIMQVIRAIPGNDISGGTIHERT